MTLWHEIQQLHKQVKYKKSSARNKQGNDSFGIVEMFLKQGRRDLFLHLYTHIQKRIFKHVLVHVEINRNSANN